MTDTRVNVGDEIRYIGGDGFDLTNNKVYTVSETRYDDEMQRNYPFLVLDDAGDANGFPSFKGSWELPNVKPSGRTFERDNRNNPALHELYVGYALETLGVISTTIHELYEHSRVDSSLVAGTLQKERARLVREDAAYFEAAAILYVGKDWLDNETV